MVGQRRVFDAGPREPREKPHARTRASRTAEAVPTPFPARPQSFAINAAFDTAGGSGGAVTDPATALACALAFTSSVAASNLSGAPADNATAAAVGAAGASACLLSLRVGFSPVWLGAKLPRSSFAFDVPLTAVPP